MPKEVYGYWHSAGFSPAFPQARFNVPTPTEASPPSQYIIRDCTRPDSQTSRAQDNSYANALYAQSFNVGQRVTNTVLRGYQFFEKLLEGFMTLTDFRQ